MTVLQGMNCGILATRWTVAAFRKGLFEEAGLNWTESRVEMQDNRDPKDANFPLMSLNMLLHDQVLGKCLESELHDLLALESYMRDLASRGNRTVYAWVDYHDEHLRKHPCFPTQVTDGMLKQAFAR